MIQPFISFLVLEHFKFFPAMVHILLLDFSVCYIAGFFVSIKPSLRALSYIFFLLPTLASSLSNESSFPLVCLVFMNLYSCNFIRNDFFFIYGFIVNTLCPHPTESINFIKANTSLFLISFESLPSA